MDQKWWFGIVASLLVMVVGVGVNSCKNSWDKQAETIIALRMEVGRQADEIARLKQVIEAVDDRRGIMIASDREEMAAIRKRMGRRR